MKNFLQPMVLAILLSACGDEAGETNAPAAGTTNQGNPWTTPATQTQTANSAPGVKQTPPEPEPKSPGACAFESGNWTSFGGGCALMSDAFSLAAGEGNHIVISQPSLQKLTFDQAKIYCSTLLEQGYADWQLPPDRFGPFTSGEPALYVISTLINEGFGNSVDWKGFIYSSIPFFWQDGGTATSAQGAALGNYGSSGSNYGIAFCIRWQRET